VKDIPQTAQILAQELLAEAAENESQIIADLQIFARGKTYKGFGYNLNKLLYNR